jgi:hypothetical protein
MTDWIDTLATTLGEEPLGRHQASELLDVARDVAHRTERRITPLSTFLLGLAAGRSMAAGRTRDEALAEAVGRLQTILPPDSAADTGGRDPGHNPTVPGT